jgi:CRP-like cAMP-binding protein
MVFEELVRAVQSLNVEDAFRVQLDGQAWRTFGNYLVRMEFRPGDLLIGEGDLDRTMFFIGQGTAQIFPGTGAGGRVVMLRSGAVVGEASLFRDGPHTANVEAMTPMVVWALRLTRFEELVQRSPAIAIEVLRAAGAVLVGRARAGLNKPNAAVTLF